ncbi:MAG TPA: energy-coupling factor transporter transmembrane protein EcfT, partial [Anaerolineae bacterium]|nr:energy-coupling factor transporter transmembrane protein EcfT [Anaerolineae bacterium]
MMQPLTWIVWLLAMATVILTLQNPLYLLIVLLVVQVVRVQCGRGSVSGAPVSLLRMAGFIFFFSSLFNLLFVHIGSTVL